MTYQQCTGVQIPALTLAALMGLVGLAGCQSTGSRADESPSDAFAPNVADSQPEVQLSASEYASRAIERLQVGDAENARGDLERALALNPRSRTAKSLLAQLDADPQAELGAKYFEYEVQTGDSLSIIAKKFLGDALKFYLLARYNDLDDPSKLDVGQRVKVPGTARPEAGGSPRAQAPKPASAAASAAPTKPAPAVARSTKRSSANNSANKDYKRAKALCTDGDYDQAIRILQANISHQPSRELLAVCYGAYAAEKSSANELGQARAMLSSAVALDPSNAELSMRLATIDDHLEAAKLYNRGVTELRAGQLESSLDSLNQALVFQPDYPAAAQKRDLVRTRLIDDYLEEAEDAFTRQRLDEAIAAWDQVLDLDPENATANSRKQAAAKARSKL